MCKTFQGFRQRQAIVLCQNDCFFCRLQVCFLTGARRAHLPGPPLAPGRVRRQAAVHSPQVWAGRRRTRDVAAGAGDNCPSFPGVAGPRRPPPARLGPSGGAGRPPPGRPAMMSAERRRGRRREPPAKYSGASWAAGRARALPPAAVNEEAAAAAERRTRRGQRGGAGRGAPRRRRRRHGGALRDRGSEGRRRAPAPGPAAAWAAAGSCDERSPGGSPPREYGHSRVQKEDAEERGHVVGGGQSEVGAGGAGLAGGASGSPRGAGDPARPRAARRLCPRGAELGAGGEGPEPLGTSQGGRLRAGPPGLSPRAGAVAVQGRRGRVLFPPPPPPLPPRGSGMAAWGRRAWRGPWHAPPGQRR